jgi:hypothetical protein
MFLKDGVSLEPVDTKEVMVSSLLHLFDFMVGLLKIDYLICQLHSRRQ